MRKKFLFVIGIILLLFLSCGWMIGSYFVDYALKRGNSDDSLAPPAACLRIGDPSWKLPPMPDISHEEWTIQSNDDLHLSATHFHPATSEHRWAILVHGYGRDRSSARDYVKPYIEHGYEVLTPDLRASGNSEGTYLTMGAKESEDIVLWAQEILRRDPEAQIVLHGVSMGAATVLLASGREDCPHLMAVIEDCGYTSAYDMFSDQLGVLFHLPSIPIMNFVNVVSWIKTGVPVSDASPIDAVAHTHVPTLFIHGDADQLVPFSMMQQLFQASRAAIKKQIALPEVAHAEAMSSNPEEYFSQIFIFLRHL